MAAAEEEEQTLFGICLPTPEDKILKKIISKLTVKEKAAPGRPKHFGLKICRCVIKDKGYVCVPKAQYQLLIDMKLLDDYVIKYPVVRKIDNIMIEEKDFFDYQIAAVNHVNQLYETQNHAYLEMETGLGKTRTGCGIIATVGEPTLVVCPTDAIATQWIDEFGQVFTDKTISMYKNTMKNPPTPETHDVIVIIINTLRKKPPGFFSGFGLVIFDEAHEYQSDKSRHIFWYCQHTRMLGLSASPNERKDGLDFIVNMFLGNPINKHDIENFDTSSVNFTVNVNIVNYVGHDNHVETIIGPTGTMSAIMTIGNIIKDPYRNKLIANEIYKYLTMKLPEGKKHGIFVFAEHRDYLTIIRDELLKLYKDATVLIPELEEVNTNISVLKGGVAKDAVDIAKKEKAHVVLTTYGFSRRGISLPDMTCLILATPRRNGLNQVVGRILRRNSDQTIVRQVVDIVDTCTGLKPQVSERTKLYKDRGYKISKTNVIWEDLQ